MEQKLQLLNMNRTVVLDNLQSSKTHQMIDMKTKKNEIKDMKKDYSQRMCLLKIKKKVSFESDNNSVATSSTVSLSSLVSSFSDTNLACKEEISYAKNSKKNKNQSKSKKGTKKIPKKKKKKATKKCELTEEDNQQFLAMDCEMVGTGIHGFASLVARVSIVSWDNEVVLDTYVKVNEPVTDFRTKVSGITSSHLDSDEAMDFDLCRELVQHLLKNKILVGHGLKNDLIAMNITHPWHMIRDTVKYKPYMKLNFEGNLVPRRLRDLCQDNLGRSIQEPGQCHDSIIDAAVAMDLYKKARKRWEKIVEWKKNKSDEILMKTLMRDEIPNQ